jgi:hypothetical protein
MDKWKIMQAGVISGVVVVTGVEVWKNPGDNPHADNETQGTAERIGHVTMSAATTSGPMAPFLNTIDSNQRRQYRPQDSAIFSSQGETETPLPLRFLRLSRSL